MALVLAVTAIALFAAAAVTDARSRRIPNAVSVALAALGLLRIAAALFAGEGALTAALDLAAAVAVFSLRPSPSASACSAAATRSCSRPARSGSEPQRSDPTSSPPRSRAG